MLRLVCGDSAFWLHGRPGNAREWLRILTLALLGGVYMSRRLLHPAYQYVGNDADLTSNWIFRFKFTRLWLAAGQDPWWNPFYQLGYSNISGPSQPYSLLSILQRVFTSLENGLDEALAVLSLILILSSAALLVRLGFSPLASVLGGLLLGGTGSVATQLFAGHLGLYSSWCLSSLIMLTLCEGLARSRIFWLFPAALCVAAAMMAGEFQGPYITLWTVSLFFLLRAALGSPEKVAPPTLWTVTTPKRRTLNLTATGLTAAERAREVGYTIVKLGLVHLTAALLATVVWFPTFASGQDWGPNTGEIFAHSAPPLIWLTMVIPHFFLGSGEVYNWAGWGQWEGQPGTGIVSTLIILLGLALRRNRDLLLPLAVGGLGALLASGKYTPFFGLYSHLDPLCGRFEVPSRMFLTVNFASALLFARAIDTLSQAGWQLPRSVLNRLLQAVAVGLALWVLGYYLDGGFELWKLFAQHVQFGYAYGGTPPVDPYAYYVLSWTRFSAAGAMATLVAYAFYRLPQGWRASFLTLLLFLDISRFSYPYANLRANEEFQVSEDIYKVITDKKLSGKVINGFQPRAVGTFSLLRLGEWSPIFTHFEPQSELLLAAARHLFRNDGASGLNELHPGLCNRFLGIQLYLQAKETLDDEQIRRNYEGMDSYFNEADRWSLVHDKQARSAVYLSRAVEAAGNPVSMLAKLRKEPKMLEGGFNFVDGRTRQAIDEIVNQTRWDQANFANEAVFVVQELPNYVDVRCQLTRPAMVILNEAWSEDWHAFVDGKEHRCLPCQLGYNRGVLVDAGQHEVRFEYRPSALLEARHISWVALVVTGTLLLFIAAVSETWKRWL